MSEKFTDARRADVNLIFNGKSVKKQLDPYLESVTYEDIAKNDSDTLEITIQNVDMKWLKEWYPQKGSTVSGNLKLLHWTGQDDTKTLQFGSFTLDEVSFSGNPRTAKFSCVAVPASESFRTRERSKTWKDVTIQAIAREIAGRYKLALKYNGLTVQIKALEQSDQTDCAFLQQLCEDYGQALKVYSNSIVIYDQTKMEQQKAVATFKESSFIDGWEYNDTLAGVYTGARISYKSDKDDKETSIYVGLKAENAKGSRVLKINETVDSIADAKHKAAVQVNKSNEEATTFSAKIFPEPKICAGICVNISGMGKIDGKYFIDKSTFEVGSSGTTQSLEMHRCQPRLKVT